jgi:hypothetical protein
MTTETKQREKGRIMSGHDFVNQLLRSKTAAGAEEQAADLSGQCDMYLDAALEGISGLRAALGVLSSDGNDDDTIDPDIEELLDSAVDALAALRDAVDEELVDRGLEPTTADLPDEEE